LTTSFGFEGACAGITASPRARIDSPGDTGYASTPAALLENGIVAARPHSGCQVVDGVEVGTFTCAPDAPLLKIATYSWRVTGSTRLTARIPAFATRTIVQPVESAGFSSRSRLRPFSSTSIGLVVRRTMRRADRR
jgi:hypothetical protein